VRFGAAVKVNGAIARDGGKPSGEFGTFAEGREAGQGLEEDVLYEVVDSGMGNAGKEDTVNHAGVTGIEKTERGAITLLSGAHQDVVGAAGVGGRIHGRETAMRGVEFKECRHVRSIEIGIVP
jgi:hypothetical protein